MSLWMHAILGLVTWFVVAVAPAAKLAFEDRGLPKERRRGVALFPIWPLVPLVFLALAAIFGSNHLLSKVIAVINLLLLSISLGYIAWWTIRLRRAG
jgi:hypothetical protein